MSLKLSLDFQFEASIEKLWLALTDSSELAKWITKNNFEPTIGHHFQFHMQPVASWDGIIEGEVLSVDKPNLLSYTWTSAGENHTVTWMLQDSGNEKARLHLEQTGFSTSQGMEGAKYGWNNWCTELQKLLHIKSSSLS